MTATKGFTKILECHGEIFDLGQKENKKEGGALLFRCMCFYESLKLIAHASEH
jgi:hypothetical protein